jgi:hypothetical protein
VLPWPAPRPPISRHRPSAVRGAYWPGIAGASPFPAGFTRTPSFRCRPAPAGAASDRARRWGALRAAAPRSGPASAGAWAPGSERSSAPV